MKCLLPALILFSLVLSLRITAQTSPADAVWEELIVLKTKQAQALKQKNFSLFMSLYASDCNFVDTRQNRLSAKMMRSPEALQQRLQMVKADLSGGSIVSSLYVDCRGMKGLYITLRTTDGRRKIVYYGMDDHAKKTPSGWKLVLSILEERRVVVLGPFSQAESILGKWVQMPGTGGTNPSSMGLTNLREVEFFPDGTLTLSVTESPDLPIISGSKVAGDWRQIAPDRLRVDVYNRTEVWPMDRSEIRRPPPQFSLEQLRQAGALTAYYSTQPPRAYRLTLTDTQNYKHVLVR